jgi:hypothetical protein
MNPKHPQKTTTADASDACAPDLDFVRFVLAPAEGEETP